MARAIHILLLLSAFVAVAGAQSVPPEAIRDAVRQSILGRLGDGAEDATVEFRSELRPVPVPSAGYRVEVPKSTLRPHGTFSVPVEILADETVVRHMLVSVRVRTFGYVLLASHQLGRSAVLSGEDVIAQRMETTNLPEDAVSSPSECAGRRTTKLINAGNVLRRSFLEPVPVIHQGERVMLTLRTGTVTLRAEALAREDGAIGSLISVQKLNSRERLRARVVGPGTAEVQLN